ncbi:flavin-containing monooxygenase [Actinospongicola halichondriae]|uniref:flavin-containing monooxygenase n=1 Tax=Actinospongicola halichondriae TaxID=3236844 RepID=UPI003D4316C7
METDLTLARERYAREREKRLRSDGLAQYQSLRDHGSFDQDPWVEPGFERDAVVEETDVVIVGGGFGGMLNAVNLLRRGVSDFRIVEKAGDFGGTWYWNRYPGCMCDVESYIYLPSLEETGYVPTMRYAPATEIFEHSQRIGKHFDLYEHALFQTEVEEATWDDERCRWRITTTRGDQLDARFLITAGGVLHKAKLPAIEGIDTFAGRAFHTARWDYGYTGGSPTEPMDRLAGKRVGVIGTGATSIQLVPQLARTAEEVYVFQRTPSAVGVRANAPTDREWFDSLEPGWQRERMRNFTDVVTGGKPDVDLVGDGWSDVLWEDTQTAPETDDEAAALERSDFETMESLRARIDEVIDDPELAERLKPWYGKHCKRICFHDEYLQAFNQPNVHLVDTDGRGVDLVDADGPIVDGRSYPVDLLIYASGFEVTTGLVSRMGFDPVGKGGLRLSERWDQGVHSLHGIHTAEFPNLLVCHFVQAGFGLNFTHYLSELTDHLSWIVAEALESGITAIEPTVEAEDEWLQTLWAAGRRLGTYAAACTPSYGNNEGERDLRAARNVVHPGNLMEFMAHLERWRDAGDWPGTTIRR